MYVRLQVWQVGSADGRLRGRCCRRKEQELAGTLSHLWQQLNALLFSCVHYYYVTFYVIYFVMLHTCAGAAWEASRVDCASRECDAAVLLL